MSEKMFYIPQHREHYLYGPDAIDQFVSEIHHERTIAHGSEDLIRQGTFESGPKCLNIYPCTRRDRILNQVV